MATHSSILACGNPMDRGDWWAPVHGVPKSQTQLSTEHLLIDLFDPTFQPKVPLEISCCMSLEKTCCPVLEAQEQE